MLTNSERLFSKMRTEGFDALVATAPENVVYTSGYWAMTQWIRRGPQAYVLVPADADAAIVGSTSALDHIVDQDVWVSDIYRYGFFALENTDAADLSASDARFGAIVDSPDYGDAISALVAAIKARGLERAVIGVDEIGMLPEYWDRLIAALPEAKINRAAGIFRHARAIKTPEEVRRLRDSAQIAERSIAAAMAIATPGVSEEQMGIAFHAETIRAGGMPVLGCIGFGTRGAMPNVQPSPDRYLAEGDLIRFDAGGRYQHYRADIARNGFLGDPPAGVMTYYNAIRKGLERAYELIRPGVTVASVFNDVMETVQREGLPHYRRNHIGHGIGLDGYDAPNIAPSSNEVFEEGMVICIETPYYELGLGGLQVEDTVHIVADGCQTLMSTNLDMLVV